jgi:hypothetical protein
LTAFANIAVSDGTDTRTFVPIMFDKNGVAWYEEQGVASSAIGNFRLSAQLVRASNPAPGESSKSRINRVKWTLHAPGLETLGTTDGGLTAPPTLAYVNRYNIEAILSERSTAVARNKEMILLANVQDNTAFVSMIYSFSGVY